MLCDLKGKVEFRSDKFDFATLKGQGLRLLRSARLVPFDAKNSLVHGQGFANAGDSFRQHRSFQHRGQEVEGLATAHPGLFQRHARSARRAPASCWQACGRTMTLTTSITGPIGPARSRQSRWQNGGLSRRSFNPDRPGRRAGTLTGPSSVPRHRYVIDTKKFQEYEAVPRADTRVGKETIRARQARKRRGTAHARTRRQPGWPVGPRCCPQER